jgi:parallel beta-helix repeat protein
MVRPAIDIDEILVVGLMTRQQPIREHKGAAVPTRAFIRGLTTLAGILGFVILASILGVSPVAAATCTDSLQSKIDATPSGGTVVADPCIYRETVTIDKPLTIEGQEGTEIRGSDVWPASVWKQRRSDRRWVSTKTVPQLRENIEDVYCMSGTRQCKWPEQVFVNGRAFSQVAGGRPARGQFGLTKDRRVVLRDDPRNVLVEVSVRKYWVLGAAEADGVTIDNVDMRHAATPPRTGALMNRPARVSTGGARWTVQNSTLSDSAGANVSVRSGWQMRLLNDHILRAGQLNIHGLSPYSEVRDSEIAYGNTERFCYNAQCGIGETGGMKVTHTHNVVVEGNDIHDNYGHGIHFDLDTFDNRIEGNQVHDNARMGIHYELSEGGTISDNDVYNNGWTTPDWYRGGGIVLQNSSSVEVYNNTVAWNADGIVVWNLDREGTEWDLVHDVYVHDNTILASNGATEETNTVALAWLQGWATTLFDPANNNRGANNEYWYTSPESKLERFRWNDKAIASLANFNATLGEENGTYLTEGEKETVVTTRGIPVSPRQR